MKEKNIFTIRMAYREEWEEAIALAWKTFLMFEAEDYGKEGTDSFRDFISDQCLKKMFLKGEYQMLVALSGNKIVGMITLRNRSHISLLFVDERYHRQGIGSALIRGMGDYLLRENQIDRITVNASPYGTVFYHKLGFKDLGPEQESEGIRYTPMEFYL